MKKPIATLTRKEVAARLGVSTRTLDRYTKAGRFIQPALWFGTPRWSEAEVDDWVKKKFASVK